MHAHQPALPALPVPALAHTLPLYLSSIRPLLDQPAYARSAQLVHNFLDSPLAATLQQRLLQRAEDEAAKGQSVQAAIAGEGGNWLADWWNALAYNTFRDPVVPYVSYYYVHRDPPSAPTPPSPALRAAQLTRAALAFRTLVDSAALAPDMLRGGVPLDMSSFRWLFNACRYPHDTEDYVRKWDPRENGHVVFVRGNRFWKVPAEGRTVGELESAISQIYSSSAPGPPIGALTSAPRSFWAAARGALLAASPSGANESALEAIESAVIVVALDAGRPETREEIGWACWAGDGRGRWYDKHQLIVFDNARSGFLGEHSAMDGTPTLRMNEFLLASVAAGKYDAEPPAAGLPAPAPEEITFELNDEVRGLIGEAEGMFDAVMAKHDMHVLHYTAYGSTLIKAHKCSPDAWVQLTMQLAWHRLFGRPGVCYESCQTRKFRRGRTEVIRSASAESKRWAETMLGSDGEVSNVAKRELFLRAAKRHLQYAALAADGQGVDRHLLGLRMVLKEGEEEVPAFMREEVYERAKHWEMSTSQLSSEWVDGWGYAEVVEDGYGLAYAIGPDYLRWTITSLRRDTARLKEALEQAAEEVRGMMEAAAREEAEEGTVGKAGARL